MRERYRTDEAFREKHKKLVAGRTRRVRAAIRSLVAEARAGGCALCPEAEPCCLDFHHVYGDKEFDIGNAQRGGYALERVRRELEKCVVICGNCHRKLHAGLIALPNLDRAVEQLVSSPPS